MTAVARLFAFTLTLVLLGSSSACITTLCLSALCGNAQTAAAPARTAPARTASARTAPARTVDVSVDAFTKSERSGHNCNLMRF